MYVKCKTYQLNKFGTPIAHIMVKINPLNLKLKAIITMANGEEYEVINQWASEEEFDIEIEKFVNNKLRGYL